MNLPRKLLLACTLASTAHLGAQSQILGPTKIRYVLLLSIDGMHSLDFLNCSRGISGTNNGAPYCPNLAALATTGYNYRNATTSKPSDSFPGFMSIVSGGSAATMGVTSLTTAPLRLPRKPPATASRPVPAHRAF